VVVVVVFPFLLPSSTQDGLRCAPTVCRVSVSYMFRVGDPVIPYAGGQLLFSSSNIANIRILHDSHLQVPSRPLSVSQQCDCCRTTIASYKHRHIATHPYKYTLCTRNRYTGYPQTSTPPALTKPQALLQPKQTTRQPESLTR
jgi:hypothetical protein